MLFDVASFLMELNSNKSEYLNSNNHKDYIGYLESGIDSLILEYDKLILENDRLSKKLHNFSKTKFSDFQLEILKICIVKGEITDIELDELYKQSNEYTSAFDDLLKDQFVSYVGYYQVQTRASGVAKRYLMNSSKKPTVIRELKLLDII